MKSANYLSILIVFTSLAGCKSLGASKVKHDYGQIANAGDLLIDCNPQNHVTAPQDAEALQYLRDHVSRLINANRAVLPKGIERICTVVSPSYAVNATASADGIVTLYRGLLWIASNDAQIAAVVAHELAHTASLHSIGGKARGNIADDNEYKETQRKIRAAFTGITSSKISKVHDAFSKLSSSLSKSLQGSTEREKLADQYLSLIGPLVKRTVIKFELFNLNEPRNITYRIITEMPVDSANRDAALNYKADEIEFKGYEDIVRMMQSNRVLLFERMDTAAREEFLRNEASTMIEMESIVTSSLEYSDLLKKLHSIEAKYLGTAVAGNWKEQDADEKGLELFLRAGYDPDEFANLFDLLNRSSEFEGETPKGMIRQMDGGGVGSSFNAASCNIADRVNPNKCERGDSTHPNSCWRAENVYNELEKHASDYAALRANAKATNVFGSKLAKLQSYYFTTLMNGANATATKANGSCVDIQPDQDTCAEKKAWQQCNETWLQGHNWCKCTCGY